MLIDAFLPLHQTIQAATEGEYRFVAKWGPPDLTRDGNGQYPRGVAIDTNNYVYVTDDGNHAIQKFSSSGTYMWECYGEGDGHLQGPWGKYGVGAMVISQRPSEVDETILSQCGTYFALRLSNPTDRARVQEWQKYFPIKRIFY